MFDCKNCKYFNSDEFRYWCIQSEEKIRCIQIDQERYMKELKALGLLDIKLGE